MENHGELKEGDLVTYSQLEQWVMEKKETNRFKGVIVAWRKALRHDNNLLLTCIPKVGYKVLNASERILVSSKRYKNGVRRIVTAAIDARDTSTEKLDSVAMKKRDHLIMQGGSYILLEKVRPKQLL